MSTQNKMEYPDGFSKDILQEIEEQNKIAIQLEEAAQLHLAAANQLKSKNYVQAFQSVISAYGIINLAKDSQRYFLDNMLDGQI
jgi:hypothetical protein